MAKLLLKDVYPFQSKITINDTYNRVTNLFGDHVTIIDCKVVEEKDLLHVEYLSLSNGQQLKLIVESDPEQEQLNISVYRQPNRDYFIEVTDEELDLLCSLAIQQSLTHFSLDGTPLLKEEQQEEEQLSYLIPKLMILTGQATETNF